MSENNGNVGPDAQPEQPRLTSHSLEPRSVNLRLTRSEASALLKCASYAAGDIDTLMSCFTVLADGERAIQAMQALDAALRVEGDSQQQQQRTYNRDRGQRRDRSRQRRDTRGPVR